MNQKNTLCLTMMVKNEAHIIDRCLESVKGFIDYWVICDTGSTDGTQQRIRSFFSKNPVAGELHEQDWKNYGHNRTLTLHTAKGKADYLLLADADYIFHFSETDFKEKLNAIAYYYANVSPSLQYKMLKLLRNDEEWRYIGVTHEYINCLSNAHFLEDAKDLRSFHVEEMCDGGNRADKFTRDIALLSQALHDDPSDLRNIFYLARSYEDISEFKNALFYYKKRIDGGGWEEENYYSRLAVTRCLIQLNKPFHHILAAALDAYEYRPTRIESLYYLVQYCREHNIYQTGYLLGRSLVDSRVSHNDTLFIHNDIYLWKLKDEVALCAYWAGAYKESYDWNLELLNTPHLPEEQRERIRKNLQYAKAKLTG